MTLKYVRDEEERFDRMRELCRKVFAASYPTKEPLKALAGLFLARGFNAAEAAKTLLLAKYPLDATSVSRTIIEAAIECAYIFMDGDKAEARATVFLEHLHYYELKLATAITLLHGTTEGNPHLVTLQTNWDTLKWNYGRSSEWCRECPGLRNRAEAVQKDLDSRNPEAPKNYVHLYELGYFEGCTASHPGAMSLTDMVAADGDSNLIAMGPEATIRWRELDLISMLLGVLVANAADPLGQSGTSSAVDEIMLFGRNKDR